MRALLPLTLVLGILSSAAATHPCTPTTTMPGVETFALSVPTGLTGHAGYYVDTDSPQVEICVLICLWIYQETNGIPDLQRGDEMVDDTCHGMIDADTIVF